MISYTLFLGTSGGKDKTLHNKIGGKCASHNLKFAIYICRDDEKDCNVDGTVTTLPQTASDDACNDHNLMV